MASAALLNSLPWVFFAAGLTLWLTSLGLAQRARRYQRGMQSLLQLAAQPLEPLDIPQAAWAALHDAGWVTLQWEGDWYGQPVHGELGLPTDPVSRKSPVQNFEVHSGAEVHLRIQMQHGKSRGERRFFATHLAQVFMLLLETRVRERTGALSAALAERARLSLYLQHDMRNLAQWVGWVASDFSSARTDTQLTAAAERLRENAPLAQERARRLNAALGKAGHTALAQEIALHDALTQAARMAGIEMAIEGEAVAWIGEDHLARVFDNLLSNLAIDWREGLAVRPRVRLENRDDGSGQGSMAHLTLTCPLPPRSLPLAPERLFEPFASGRPGGLGLGLYQARKSLREAGGDLQAAVVGGELEFALRLPEQVTETVPMGLNQR